MADTTKPLGISDARTIVPAHTGLSVLATFLFAGSGILLPHVLAIGVNNMFSGFDKFGKIKRGGFSLNLGDPTRYSSNWYEANHEDARL